MRTWLGCPDTLTHLGSSDVSSRGSILQFLAKITFLQSFCFSHNWRIMPVIAAVLLQLMNCATDKWRPWAFRLNATLVLGSRCSPLAFVVPESEEKNAEKTSSSAWYPSSPSLLQTKPSSRALLRVSVCSGGQITLLLLPEVEPPTFPSSSKHSLTADSS